MMFRIVEITPLESWGVPIVYEEDDMAKSKDFDTKDSTSRHPTDADLRERGFRIHSRPGKDEPVWERGGVLYPESKAVQEVTSDGK